MVTPDITEGRTLLELLDAAQLGVDAAYWLLLPNGEWRLFLHAPFVDSLGTKAAYRKLLDALRNSSLESALSPRTISLVTTSDPTLRLLRSAVTTEGKGIHTIRFTGNVINGVYVEDAILYRL